MNRIALALAQAIVALALLSAFGWVVKHRTKGDLNLGAANAWIDGVSGFPDPFQQSVESVQTVLQAIVDETHMDARMEAYPAYTKVRPVDHDASPALLEEARRIHQALLAQQLPSIQSQS